MLQETAEREEIIERVAALDIGKAGLMCCVRVPHEGKPGRRLQEVAAYSTMTGSLLRLADRLRCLGVTWVVMEATSDYWRPADLRRRHEAGADHLPFRRPCTASDIFGKSGRAMMAALIAGERNPKALAQLARTRMRGKISALEEAFTGHFTDHHAFLLGKMLARIDAIDADIAELDTKIEEMIAPFALGGSPAR